MVICGRRSWLGDAFLMIPYFYWKRYGDDMLIRLYWDQMVKCFGFYKNELEKEIFLHCLNRDTVSIPSICAHVEEILVSGRNQTTVHLVKHHFYFRIQRKVQLILRLMQGLWRRWRSIWDTMMLRCTENSMKM